MAKKSTKGGKKETQKTEKAEKKAKPKAEKKSAEVVVTQVKHNAAKPEKEIEPATGSRFKPNTSAQIALDIVVKGIAEGKDQNTIRDELGNYRKKNGCSRDLDRGYFPYVVATHPEFFETKSDGSIKQLKEFTPDPEALKKIEEAKKVREQKKTERKGKSKKSSKSGKGKGNKPTLKK